MAKFNVKFSESVYRVLAGIALERGQTMADVLRDEVARAAWMDDELRQGNHFLIDRKGTTNELVFAHQALLHPAGRPMPPEGPAPQESKEDVSAEGRAAQAAVVAQQHVLNVAAATAVPSASEVLSVSDLGDYLKVSPAIDALAVWNLFGDTLRDMNSRPDRRTVTLFSPMVAAGEIEANEPMKLAVRAYEVDNSPTLSSVATTGAGVGEVGRDD